MYHTTNLFILLLMHNLVSLSWWWLKFSRNVDKYKTLSIFGVTVVLYFTHIQVSNEHQPGIWMHQCSLIIISIKQTSRKLGFLSIWRFICRWPLVLGVSILNKLTAILNHIPYRKITILPQLPQICFSKSSVFCMWMRYKSFPNSTYSLKFET